MSPSLAHTGHWALWLVYLLPVGIVITAAIRAVRSPPYDGDDPGADDQFPDQQDEQGSVAE